jgi:hypothetical protein
VIRIAITPAAYAAIAGNVEPTKGANAIDRPITRETRLAPRALAVLDWRRRAERLGLHYRKLNPP